MRQRIANYIRSGQAGICIVSAEEARVEAEVKALAATLNEEVDTLVDMVEPFLLQQGFISRTSRGRKANGPAYQHLGIAQPGSTATPLFE